MYNNLKKWAFSPVNKKPVHHKTARTTVRVLLILGHVFSKIDIPMRASALTFSIILAMVPMLAMSTAILKGLGSDNKLKIAAHRMLDQIEPPPEIISNGNDSNKSIEASPEQDLETKIHKDNPDEESKGKALTSHLRNGLDTIFSYADKTNFAALGAFGIAGLIVIVLMMMSNIEATMNAIWHSRKNRPLGRKIMDYLALLILLPISLNLAFAGDAILHSPQIMSYLSAIIPSEWIIKMIFKGLPFIFIVASLSFMYQFFPNTKVKAHAAFTGAVFATLCWFIVQQIYITLQIGVANYNAIYGSFATVPLFLIWLHLGWIFLLLGSALAFAVQNRNIYNPQPDNIHIFSPKQQLQLAYDIMTTVYNDFGHKRPTTIKDLSIKTSEQEAATITKKLIDNGLLYSINNGKKQTVTPAIPMESIETKDILTAILGRGEIDSPGGNFTETVLSAAAQAVKPPVFSHDT
jgi:membrane protein